MSKFPIAFAILLAGLTTPAVAQSADAPAAFGDEARVEDSTLNGVAGRADVNQLLFAEHTTEVSNNTVGNNSTTGNVRIDGNAFQNMSGFSIVSANSGNQSAISSQMSVNISLSTTN